MKFKVKALVVATVMAACGHASAEMQDSFVQNGGLFLMVWDSTAKKSYVRDLGVNLDSFLPSNATTSTFTSATSAFTDQFSGSTASNINWMVLGVDGITGDGLDNGKRFSSTFGASPSGKTNATVASGADNVANLMSDLVTNAGMGANGAEYTSNWVPYSIPNPQGGAPITVTPSPIGSDGPGFMTILSGANLGTAAISGYNSAMFWLGSTGTDSFAGPDAATWMQYGGNMTLSSTGELTYTASAVPVPAAVWLMGSGLAGLLGAARRRKTV